MLVNKVPVISTQLTVDTLLEVHSLPLLQICEGKFN